LCRAFNHTEVGQGGPCDGVGDSVDECRGGTLIGGWAVGGEVGNTIACSWGKLEQTPN